MISRAGTLPRRKADLQLVPWPQGGGVVKNRATDEYFELGSHEFFLLSQFDGNKTFSELETEYAVKFGEPLNPEFLEDYFKAATDAGWLQPDEPIPASSTTAEQTRPPNSAPQSTPSITAPADRSVPTTVTVPPLVNASFANSSDVVPAITPASATKAAARQSLLYFRFRLLDPDRILNVLAPRLWFLWTWPFVLLSVALWLAAGVTMWINHQQFSTAFAGTLQWHTLGVVWITLVLVTVVHEFAHGLTCKRFGGEVHDMGFMVMMFMPCLYCNVSDAWMFPEKWRRLVVTLAGAWNDLCVWALAVLVWRVSAEESLLNYLAAVVVTVVGLRVFVNLLPLFKLDGYYLLSDGLGVPNLYQRGRDAFQQSVRQVLWAAPGDVPVSKGLALYGWLAWTMTACMLIGLSLTVYHFLGTHWGVVGIAGATFLGVAVRGTFSGFGPGENAVDTNQPWNPKSKRLARWAVALIVVGGVLCIPVPDLIHGTFELRPHLRVQVRAPVAGFLRSVAFDEGEPTSAGDVLAVMDVPDLPTRLAQKQAELAEAQARLALLDAGPRPEQVEWQTRRLTTARTRAETAQQRLERARLEEAQTSQRLSLKVAQHKAESQAAKDAHLRRVALYKGGVLPAEQLKESEKREEASAALLGQVEAEQRIHEVTAARAAEDEWTLRQREVQEAEAELAYVKLGSRPEEIDAEKARIQRLDEELQYLQQLQSRLTVTAGTSGIVTSPRLKEKVGQYLREGDVICEIEDVSEFEAEVLVSEDELNRVKDGQNVRLKVRAAPFDSLKTTIDRIAPRAQKHDVHNRVTLICTVAGEEYPLRSGMTGSARIDGGWQPLGKLMIHRAARFLRNEFWWW